MVACVYLFGRAHDGQSPLNSVTPNTHHAGSNIFFLALLAMTVAVFTMRTSVCTPEFDPTQASIARVSAPLHHTSTQQYPNLTGWVESIQKDVPVNAVLTDANLKFGVFDMSARVTQAGQVVWQQYSYNWCVRVGVASVHSFIQRRPLFVGSRTHLSFTAQGID